MIVIGITGSFGTGKSTVAAMLKRRGAEIIDADKIVHELLSPQGRCFRKVVKAFGPRFLAPDGRLDKPLLARFVFDAPGRRKELERILHPEVIRDIKRILAQFRRGGRVLVVALDIPLLYEAGLEHLADINLVVRATQEEQLQRTARRGSLTRRQRLRRIRAQMPLREKIIRADVVIDNRGTLKETDAQVGLFWKKVGDSCKTVKR